MIGFSKIRSDSCFYVRLNTRITYIKNITVNAVCQKECAFFNSINWNPTPKNLIPVTATRTKAIMPFPREDSEEKKLKSVRRTNAIQMIKSFLFINHGFLSYRLPEINPANTTPEIKRAKSNHTYAKRHLLILHPGILILYKRLSLFPLPETAKSPLQLLHG